MLRENSSALHDASDAQLSVSRSSATSHYTAHDVTVVIAELPANGAVLRPDGFTALRCGETVTAAELAALTFAPGPFDGVAISRSSGPVVCAPQSCVRMPVVPDPEILAAPDRQVVILELPTNGFVFLADGATAVAVGQTITAAQLGGLTFSPAENAIGKISVLRYAFAHSGIVGDVLFVVGPDAPSQGVSAAANGASDSSLAPVAVALLLDMGLSASPTVAAPARDPNDAAPAKTAGPIETAPRQDADSGATEPVRDYSPVAPVSTILAESATLASDSVPTEEPPQSRIGSSTPPDIINLTLASTPLSQASTNLSASTTIPSLAPSTIVTTDQQGNLPSGAATFTMVGAQPGGLAAFQMAGFATAPGVKGLADVAPTSTPPSHASTNLSMSTTISSLASSPASSMTVTADKQDYPPGSTATFTVTGVKPGSSVSFQIADLANAPGVNGVADVYAPFAVVDGGAGDADGLVNGVVVAQWQVPADGRATGAEMQLTATSGGNAATTTFADAANAIVLENQKPGTPMSVWQIDPGEDSTKIQGYTAAISTNVGGTVQFKINNQTGVANYSINIYRLGYYGGNGARLITTLQHQASSPVVQPAPVTNAATGEVDAGNWSVTDSWAVPSDAVSGVYIANIVEGNQIFQIPFVVRNDSSNSAIVFQTSDETWQAYNPWGGADLYAGNGPGVNGSAYAVSYNRPITTRDSGKTGFAALYGSPNDMVFSAEFPTIYWLEQNGYDVSYISGMDAATNGSLLLNHKVYMDSGHDEYWTDSQYNNVLAARQAGVNLMFLSGNEVYWQTRFAPSIDSTPDPNRTLITYKDTHANTLIDPSGTATSTFMDARFSSTGGLAGTPSNALTGQVFSVDSDRVDTITIPYGQTKLRIWNNTAVGNTAAGGTASLEPGILGYEWDSSPDNGFRPAGLVNLSSTTLQVDTLLLDYGNTTGTGTATHNLVEFRDPVSGALVFGSGTVFWSWGLSDQHDVVAGTLEPVDPSVQQATVNLFADMGVQPGTLQASLVVASASTDHTAPTSRITNLSTTSVVEGQPVTVTGTATDVGGVIGGVEVSSDGGKTWHPATSTVGAATVSWSYTFNAGAAGAFKVESRAVDDSINLETPSDATSYTVLPSSNLTIFGASATPAVANTNDSGAIEVGVKFVSADSGKITGIRFYKGSQNTGTHLGDLWSSSGQLLASATFTNETASGWQQVNFASPVNIQAGQTYIASYHTNTGFYSSTDFYFDNAGHTNGALTATGNGLNGVYNYGSGPIFPNTVSFANSDNFWVDVVFDDTNNGGPQANSDSGFTVTENGSTSIPASTLLANDTDSAGLSFSLTGVSGAVNGTASYNSQTQTVTFTPTANYAGTASFLYTIQDTSGATATGQVSLKVNYPATAQSLFGTNDTPAEVNSNDSSSVELGVKFTASTSGTITGIRFYKGSANIGTHIADLWSSTGTLLATATFSNETASGWQQVNFSSPVAITAGTTYVASYHTNGFYSDDLNYFTSPVSNGNLTAGTAGNGIYAYGSGSLFPTLTYKSTNYWVDVVFNSSAVQPPVANNDSGFVATKNTALSINASQLLANDTDPNGLTMSITGVSNPANGTVAYNASTQVVTFTPTANYTGPASFTYSITDANGGVASANVALTVNAPSQPPVANNDSGFATNANTAVNIAASALLANDTDPNGLALSVTGVSSPVSGAVSYNSQTQTVTFTPTTGYTGPASFTYSITDTAGGVASANVALTVNGGGSSQPPVANNDSGFSTNRNTAVNILASSLLANDTDPNGLPLSITGVSGPANGTVSYNSQTQVVSFTPTANYTGPASFTYSITDANGGVASANVALTVNVPATQSLFSASSTPATADVTSTRAIELGVKFTASTNGTITGIRFYKGPLNIGTHVADLWTSTGTRLATATFTNETTSGWQQVNFATPVSITAGTTYVASYHTNVGRYSTTTNYFTSNVVSGDLTAPASGNGVSSFGSGSVFPTSTSNATNYWVDVVYTKSTQPPVANNDSGFSTNINTALNILGSALLANDTDPNGQALSVTGVSNPVNGTVTYNSQTKTVTFTPKTGYAGTASFNYSIADANGGVAAANVALTVSGSVQPPVANNDSGFVATQNTALSINASQLLANDTDPNGLTISITGVSNPANGAVAYNASTQVVTFTPTANYTGPASFTYSITDANGGVASANVALTVNPPAPPPVANNDSGFTTNANTAVNIAASALLANDTDPNGLALSITGVSNPANGTVSYNSQTQTVTFTPTANYTGPASFTYSIADTAGGVASASVALTVNAAAPTESLFSASSTPATVTVNDPAAVELGVKFTASANGQITGLRFYKGPQNTGTHVADLWSSTGTLLASATFTNETASGWQQVNFATPVSITAGTTYVASYHTNVGEYSATGSYFTSNVVSGDLTAPAAGNGVYAYGSGSLFPTSTFSSTNYWVDVVYTKSMGQQPPVANNDGGFVATVNTALSINASQLLANDTDPNGQALSITGVSNPANGTVAYNASTKVVTFTPTSNYTGPASFTYSITDTGGGVASANVALTVNDPSTSSLFSASSTPSVITDNDPKAVELGVKFQSSTAGQITGLRFYKGPQNTGTHVADLWSSTGTLLATATFSNETASGWQQVNFSTPVSITAGTTYIASYHTNTGEYSADPNLFANTLTNGPLTAPSSSSSGGNGVYAYGSSSLFPTSTFNSTSYGVDVVFKPQLAA